MSYYIQVIVPPPYITKVECIPKIQSITENQMQDLIIAGAHPKPINYQYVKPIVITGICHPYIVPAYPQYTITLTST